MATLEYLALSLAVWFAWFVLVVAPVIGGCYWLCHRFGWDGTIPGPKGGQND